MTRVLGLTLAALAASLAACGESGAPAPAPTVTGEMTAGGVTREEVAPAAEPAMARMAPATAIQSQPGPDGSQVDLLSAKVTGDILTVTLRCSSEDRVNTESFSIPDISVIDDATSQRISVLKDNAGKWLASRPAGDNLMASCEAKPGVIWAKFPAPPPTSKTVSINLPAVAPFDGVPVAR